MMQDYYAILEVKPDATLREIKLAYRKKIKIYHPDQNKSKDAEKITKLLNEAYKALSSFAKETAFNRENSAPNNNVYRPQTPTPTRVYRNVQNAAIDLNESSGSVKFENDDGTSWGVEWNFKNG